MEATQMRLTCGQIPNSTLSLIAIALVAACGGGDGNGGPVAPPPPPPASVTITTGDSPPPRFIPTNATVAAAGMVKWTNGSPVAHNLRATTANWQLNEDLPVGGSFNTTIAQVGTYRYQCTLHADMVGAIVVK
jgi:plastocyanin